MDEWPLQRTLTTRFFKVKVGMALLVQINHLRCEAFANEAPIPSSLKTSETL